MYKRQLYDSTNQKAFVFVKYSGTIPAGGSKTIYMYYGNPDAADESSFDAVDRYESFENVYDRFVNTEGGQLAEFVTTPVKLGSYALHLSDQSDADNIRKYTGDANKMIEYTGKWRICYWVRCDWYYDGTLPLFTIGHFDPNGDRVYHFQPRESYCEYMTSGGWNSFSYTFQKEMWYMLIIEVTDGGSSVTYKFYEENGNLIANVTGGKFSDTKTNYADFINLGPKQMSEVYVDSVVSHKLYDTSISFGAEETA